MCSYDGPPLPPGVSYMSVTNAYEDDASSVEENASYYGTSLVFLSMSVL